MRIIIRGVTDTGMQPHKSAPTARWQPAFGDLVTVGALVVAVVMWFDPPSWQFAIPVVAVTIGAVIFTALRHKSHLAVRGTIGGAVVVVLALVAWRPIWVSFHKDYPRATFNWPIALNPAPAFVPIPASPDPPDLPPTDLPGPPLSRTGKSMFLCQFPENIVAQDPEAVLAAIRQNLDVYGRATGLSLVINRIPYGFRIDTTADGPDGQVRMGGMRRYTFQVERTTQGMFVTITFDIGTLGILEMMPVDPKVQKMLTTLTSQMLGVSEDKCRML